MGLASSDSCVRLLTIMTSKDFVISFVLLSTVTDSTPPFIGTFDGPDCRVRKLKEHSCNASPCSGMHDRHVLCKRSGTIQCIRSRRRQNSGSSSALRSKLNPIIVISSTMGHAAGSSSTVTTGIYEGYLGLEQPFPTTCRKRKVLQDHMLYNTQRCISRHFSNNQGTTLALLQQLRNDRHDILEQNRL